MNERQIISSNFVTTSGKENNKKVKYNVSKANAGIFKTQRYTSFFKYLKSVEDELDKPLNFDVYLDYMTLYAFDSLDDKTLSSMKNILGDKVFHFFTDMSLSRRISTEDRIPPAYLNEGEFLRLKEYYDLNEDVVVDSFRKGYSSLPLYGALYCGKGNSILLSNIRDYTQKSKNDKIRYLACKLIIDLENEARIMTSERAHEELYHQTECINRVFPSLTPEDVPENISNADIDDVYQLLLKRAV